MRLFIAVELPDEVKRKISELIDQLKVADAGIKWVEAVNLHMTLKFLGWVGDQKAEAVFDLVNQAITGTGSFPVRFESAGTFPAGQSPRVIWVGVSEGGDQLKSLAESLEQAFSRAGYRSEERAFSSHVTIGRIKNNEGVDKIKEKIDGFRAAYFGTALINSIAVMKSALTPKGPIYEKIKEVKL